MEADSIRGKQIKPSSFTNHIKRIHNQSAYPAIRMKHFIPAPDFSVRVEKAIRRGKRNKAIGSDGLHMEMFQVAPAICARILTYWLTMIGRLCIFRSKWAEVMLCPLCKKGDQADQANYRPVCLLSHARKLIDTAILSIVSEQFSPAAAQFCFQASISVHQALLCAQANGDRGIHHVLVLDLENSYDKVDLAKLRHAAAWRRM